MRRIGEGTVCGILSLLVLAGCSQSGPELAPVSGRVTLDGQPLVGVTLMFQPEGTGSPSYGATDQDGRYQLGYNRTRQGAMIGWHTIRIQADNIVPGPNGQPRKRDKPVPSQYSKGSELRRDVKLGDNVINFELTTSSTAEK
jgi:hypothetical protein